MKTFDLQCNEGTWTLTNISSEEAKDVHFQLNKIIVDEMIRLQRPDIEVNGIESLKPGVTASLIFGDKFIASALMRTEHDEKQREIGSRGYLLKIFFEHPSEAHQTVYFWEK
jgi:hypothetical protein